MKSAFLCFGAVGATANLYTFQPHAAQMPSSAVGASQLDMHAAALPSPSWSGNVQYVTVSDTAGPAESMAAQLTAGAGIFGAALVTGLLGRALARRPAPRARLVMMAEAPAKEKTAEKTGKDDKEPEPP